jgi:DNA methylase
MRHPLHSLCPYFAMFPEDFVAKHVLAFTERGDTVFDPFCGRGTTILESLINGREAAGVDINPVAACVSGAKADPPTLSDVIRRLAELETIQRDQTPLGAPESEFFMACFHQETLQQVLFLREALNWLRSRTDRFIAAVTLGCLHGESHKSQNYLSNRMPRTISTKPDYSVRWWSERGYVAPWRDAFEVLRRVAAYRLSHPTAPLRGAVHLRDARQAGRSFPKLQATVKLIVTSPPYLDTTDYSEDQWLRLWFLGGEERPILKQNKDDRYTNVSLYWTFLSEAWRGCAALVRHGTILVIRIGGSRLQKSELSTGLLNSLQCGLSEFIVTPLYKGVTTLIKNRQTNSFRPGTSSLRHEHDFVFELA